MRPPMRATARLTAIVMHQIIVPCTAQLGHRPRFYGHLEARNAWPYFAHQRLCPLSKYQIHDTLAQYLSYHAWQLLPANNRVPLDNSPWSKAKRPITLYHGLARNNTCRGK